MNKLAIEPGFICFPTNLKLIEGGGALIRRGAYLMFGLTGARLFGEGRLFERGRLFEEIRYSPIYLRGHIRSRDAFRPITRDQQLKNGEALTVLCSVVKHAESG